MPFRPRLLRLSSGQYRVRLRSRAIPPWWIDLSPSRGSSIVEVREWELLLSARGIPHRVTPGRHVHVPPLLAGVARREREAFREDEARPRPPQPRALPVRGGAAWANLALIPLLLWHLWRVRVLPCPEALPPPETWIALGALDSAMLHIHGEGWRCLTALFLHADAAHIVANLALSAFALPAVARTLGVGRAWLLALAGGFLGNLISLPFRTPPYSSIGFSTAFFALVGMLGGLAPSWRGNAIPPLAAAGGLLAMLGADGGSTDYAAHVGGLIAGLALGLLEKRRLLRLERERPGATFSRTADILAGVAAVGLAVGGWVLAMM